jgi:hypothetical protein
MSQQRLQHATIVFSCLLGIKTGHSVPHADGVKKVILSAVNPPLGPQKAANRATMMNGYGCLLIPVNPMVTVCYPF